MRTVLVVEDNPLHSKLFAEILQHYGYRVCLASDGAEGLPLAHRELPDLMIIDCYLPSEHPLETVRAACADGVLCHTPIIATSAFAGEDERAGLHALGCAGYVPKPISVGPFMATVRSVLKETATSDQAGPARTPARSTA